MKSIFIVIAFLGTTIATNAQDLVWETDVYKAISKSNEVKKPILIFFTGSDWCGWCIRLQSEVFKTPEFAAWANKNVVLVELDFPKRTAQAENLKAQNNSLQQTFAVQGFPSIRLVNAAMKDATINFELLGGLGYMAGGPTAWINNANDVLKLNTKVYEQTNTIEPKAKTGFNSKKTLIKNK